MFLKYYNPPSLAIPSNSPLLLSQACHEISLIHTNLIPPIQISVNLRFGKTLLAATI